MSERESLIADGNRKPPILQIHRCDHLRPVVKFDGKWCHIAQDSGVLLGFCEAGIYREPVSLPDNWGSLFDYRVRDDD